MGEVEEHLHAKAVSVESRIYIPYFIFGTLLSYRIIFADQTDFKDNVKTFILFWKISVLLPQYFEGKMGTFIAN